MMVNSSEKQDRLAALYWIREARNMCEQLETIHRIRKNHAYDDIMCPSTTEGSKNHLLQVEFGITSTIDQSINEIFFSDQEIVNEHL